MILTLFLGGGSALRQDAVDGYWSVHNGMNTLSNQVTGALTNLHNDLPGSNSGS